MVRVCFVCLGNICRSPTAEGVFRKLVEDENLGHAFVIGSAGTGDWHVGEPPDPRAVAAARARGVDVSGTAEQFTARRFDEFDYVVAMDTENRSNLSRMARSENDRAKIHLLRDFEPGSARNASVPDPYYGGADGFDEVFDLCVDAARGLLETLRERHRIG